jgi:hypothetical protein
VPCTHFFRLPPTQQRRQRGRAPEWWRLSCDAGAVDHNGVLPMSDRRAGTLTFPGLRNLSSLVSLGCRVLSFVEPVAQAAFAVILEVPARPYAVSVILA